MPEIAKKPALGEALNGIKTPLYFDRQVVRAADLNLDRRSHDEELERMRRLLHGWGIVAGLDVIQDGDTLTVGRGYGVTPTGEEVFLRERLVVTDLAARIWACCGPGPRDCAMVDEAEIFERAASGETSAVISWLVARPTRTLGEPRSGVAEGCQHPANTLLPTRACEGVRLELLCSLPPPHGPQQPSCESVSPYFCGHGENPLKPFLAMPEAYDDDLSYLVLCVLVGRIDGDQLFATMHPVHRTTLLPASVLQKFLEACVCPVLSQPGPDVEDDEPEVGVGPDEDRDIVDGFQRQPREVGWPAFRGKLREERFIGQPRDVIPDDDIIGRPHFEEKLGLFDDPEIFSILEEIDINGPRDFAEAEATVIAAAIGVPTGEVEQAQRLLGGMRFLYDGPRY